MRSELRYESFRPPAPDAEKIVTLFSEGFEADRYFQTGEVKDERTKLITPFDIRYNGKTRVFWYSPKDRVVAISHTRGPEGHAVAYTHPLFDAVSLFGASCEDELTVDEPAKGQYIIDGKYSVLSSGERAIDGVRVAEIKVKYTETQGNEAVAEAYFAADLGLMPFGFTIFRNEKVSCTNRVLRYQEMQTDTGKIHIPIEYEQIAYWAGGDGKSVYMVLSQVADVDSVKINLDIPDKEFDTPLNLNDYNVYDQDLGEYVAKEGGFQIMAESLDILKGESGEAILSDLRVPTETVQTKAQAPSQDDRTTTVTGAPAKVRGRAFIPRRHVLLMGILSVLLLIASLWGAVLVHKSSKKGE